MPRLSPVFALIFTAGCLCSSPPSVHGTVNDLWGNPIASAQVKLSEVPEVASTSSSGEYTLPLAGGIHKLSADAEGYIATTTDIEVVTMDEGMEANLILTPEPASNGYFAVGEKELVAIKSQPIRRVGTQIKHFYGVEQAGDVELPSENFRVIFHTDLRRDQVSRLRIELHKLDYTEEGTVLTVEGEQEVELNMWTTGGEVELDRTPLDDGTNYLYFTDSLAPGTYAFVSEDMLETMTKDSFEAVPETARKAYVFTVK